LFLVLIDNSLAGYSATSRHKNFDVRTFRAEDEISAIAAAIGASFSGHWITATSGQVAKNRINDLFM
jgi:pyruvate/2-oxoacid:ferredoxin oxidoreductase alpha subunit